MTRKDYIRIAAALRRARATVQSQPGIVSPYHVFKHVTDELCAEFAADNRRFDSARFRRAIEGDSIPHDPPRSRAHA